MLRDWVSRLSGPRSRRPARGSPEALAFPPRGDRLPGRSLALDGDQITLPPERALPDRRSGESLGSQAGENPSPGGGEHCMAAWPPQSASTFSRALPRPFRIEKNSKIVSPRSCGA